MMGEKSYLPHGERLRTWSNLAPQKCSTFHRVWSYLVRFNPQGNGTACLTISFDKLLFAMVIIDGLHVRGEAAAKAVLLNEKEPSRSPSFQKKGAR